MRGYWVNFSILLFHTPVAQLEEAAVSKPVNVRVQIPPGGATRSRILQVSESSKGLCQACSHFSHASSAMMRCESGDESLRK